MTKELWMHPDSVRTVCFDFTDQLVSGTHTLSGSPTISIDPPGLSQASATVLGGTFTDPATDETCAANMGVSAILSSTKKGRYAVTVSCAISGGGAGETAAETFYVTVSEKAP